MIVGYPFRAIDRLFNRFAILGIPAMGPLPLKKENVYVIKLKGVVRFRD